MEALAQSMTIDTGGRQIGVEIKGVDLSSQVDDETFQGVRDAYYRHSVLVFRNQRLTPQQQVDFSRRFGDLEIHVLKQFLLKQNPEILVISNIVEGGVPIGLADAGRVAVWHTDMSYLQMPSAGSLLYSLEIPRDERGESLGDTLFASTFAAYDALSENMKKRLHGLMAIHHMTKGYDDEGRAGGTRLDYDDEQRNSVPDQAHPIIRTHPVTGRKCIYINKLCVTGIVGMPERESGPLLEELYQHCTQSEFVYRHRWQVGDLVMWDNCSVQHLAVQDYELPMRRRMHRTTLKGSIPF